MITIDELNEIKSRKPMNVKRNSDYQTISKDMSEYNQKMFNKQCNFINSEKEALVV